MTTPSEGEAMMMLVRSAFNEGFAQGIREHKGGYSWRDSKAKVEAERRVALLSPDTPREGEK